MATNKAPIESSAPGSATEAPDSGADTVDVTIAGAGVAGLVLGLALARGGLRVVVAGRVDARAPGRTVALLEGSIALLERLGLWPDLASEAEPLRVMRLVDDTGSLFRVPPVSFRAEEIGRAAFGSNIPNAVLVERLAAAARNAPGLDLVETDVTALAFEAGRVTARLADGRRVAASLLAACDGRNSPARTAAGIPVKTWRYPQQAVTAILRHAAPHGGVSTEFHTRQGPFTLVPLPALNRREHDGVRKPVPTFRHHALEDAPHRSSLVWVLRPEEAERVASLDRHGFAQAVERQSRRLLGSVAVEGEVGRFPLGGLIADRMAASRLALVGEAAHAMPPIGAQGLNLGLRDVAALADLLVVAKRRGADLGGAAVLDAYARVRRGDVALRTMGVDWLNRSLLSRGPADLVRGAAFAALDRIGPLRRAAMRGGLTTR